MKRIPWKVDTVINVEVRPDLFTIAQIRPGSWLQFFRIRSNDGAWEGVDLDGVEPLFCLSVADRPLRPLFAGTLSASQARASRRPMPRRVINYGSGCQGKNLADLVELTCDASDPRRSFSTIGARVIKAGLTIEADLDDIHAHELVGMYGDPRKLRARLSNYFDTGVNWDPSKAFLCKGIEPPSTKPDVVRPDSARRPTVRKKQRLLLAVLEADVAALPRGASRATKLARSGAASKRSTWSVRTSTRWNEKQSSTPSMCSVRRSGSIQTVLSPNDGGATGDPTVGSRESPRARAPQGSGHGSTGFSSPMVSPPRCSSVSLYLACEGGYGSLARSQCHTPRPSREPAAARGFLRDATRRRTISS